MTVAGGQLQVILDGIAFEVYAGAPDPGKYRIELEDIDGWWERAVDSTDASPHWSGIGQTTSSRSTGPRPITLSLYIVGLVEHGPGSPRAGLERLSRISNCLLVVAEAGASATCLDVRVLKVQRSQITPTEFLVTVSLTADDPLRYSAESRPLSNGAVLLPNRGDQTAFGRLALTGPHGAITIAHPGGTWTFPALGSGASRLIDFRELRVWNGTARVFGEGSGPAPRVLSGGSQWTVSGLGSGAAVLSRAEAWS